MASVKRLNRAGLGFSQQGFQLVKDLFDWIEIETEGLRITQNRCSGLNGCLWGIQ